MDKKEYLKQLAKLNRAYVKDNNPYKFGEIVKDYRNREVVLLDVTGVNKYGGIEYGVLELNLKGEIVKETSSYGFETYKKTGQSYDLSNTKYDDIL